MTATNNINFLINLAKEYGHSITVEEAKKADAIISSMIDEEEDYYYEAKSYFAN